MEKVLLFLLCALLSNGFYVTRAEEWQEIPLEDGTFKTVSASELQKMINAAIAEDRGIDFKVTFILYTKQNPKGELIQVNNVNSLQKSHFDARNPTRFIIHGWINSKSSPISKKISSAYLNRGNFNAFIVDWSSAARTPNYVSAKNRVERIGKKVATFIDFLHNFGGMSLNNAYIIGHSLGAHVAGYAAKNIRTGRLNTIIGLDAALPLFSVNKPNQRLSKDDADYVELIHTNGKKFGIYDPIGHADFYPNGGKNQQGCSISNTCSHARAYNLYAESISINNKFNSIHCNRFEDIINKQCLGHYGDVRLGGEPSNYGKASGIYYLETNSKSPYGKGFFSKK